MELAWKISDADVQSLRRFVAEYDRDPLVLQRKNRNLASAKPQLTESAFWHALLGSLLTTQQKSGPDSAVARLMRARPFPLGYELCRLERHVDAFATRILVEFGGIRRTKTIGRELAANLKTLEDGLWPEVLRRLNFLRPAALQPQELAAAEFLAEHLLGLGPKQSRNLLQGVGLTRFEVPIDSRFTKWLNKFGFPVRVSAAALSDSNYYRFVSQGIQQLCAAADVFPCVLDAAIFASFDHGHWRDDNLEDWGELQPLAHGDHRGT
jgi:hypothetical protein